MEAAGGVEAPLALKEVKESHRKEDEMWMGLTNTV